MSRELWCMSRELVLPGELVMAISRSLQGEEVVCLAGGLVLEAGL